MQVDNETTGKASLKLMYPDWVRADNKSLVNLITERKIFLIKEHKKMLATALEANLLSSPCSEYEILARILALELMEQGFLILDKGLVDEGKYKTQVSNF